VLVEGILRSARQAKRTEKNCLIAMLRIMGLGPLSEILKNTPVNQVGVMSYRENTEKTGEKP